MMNAYGKYAQERNSAWKTLLDCEINYLPVDVIKVSGRNKIGVYRNSGNNILKSDEFGACFEQNGRWIIVYDDTVCNEEKRYTIAHELGHILLAHNEKITKKYRTLEDAADSFAQKLLTPLCVLKELGITTKEEIAKVCDVPMWIAEKRATRLKAMIKRDKFYTSPLETQVKELFDSFIKREKDRLDYNRKYRKEDVKKFQWTADREQIKK